jgi:hypothetical protein
MDNLPQTCERPKLDSGSRGHAYFTLARIAAWRRETLKQIHLDESRLSNMRNHHKSHMFGNATQQKGTPSMDSKKYIGMDVHNTAR